MLKIFNMGLFDKSPDLLKSKCLFYKEEILATPLTVLWQSRAVWQCIGSSGTDQIDQGRLKLLIFGHWCGAHGDLSIVVGAHGDFRIGVGHTVI